jgi:outer membrane protein W
MKKTLLAIAALTALTSGAAMAQQQDGNWMVRVRAVHRTALTRTTTGSGLVDQQQDDARAGHLLLLHAQLRG